MGKSLGLNSHKIADKFGLNSSTNNNLSDIAISSELDIRQIDVNLIRASDKNREFEMSNLEQLAESIENIGLIHNLCVRPIEDKIYKYELISGERRLRAVRDILKWPKVVCLVLPLTNDDIQAEITLLEVNLETRDNSDMKKAIIISRLKELYDEKRKNGGNIKGRTIEHVAQKMGISPKTAQRLDNLNKLIPEIQNLIDIGTLGATVAEQFSYMDESAQKTIFETLLEQGNKINKDEATKLKTEWKKDKDTLASEIDKLNNKLSEKDKLIEEIEFEKELIQEDLDKKATQIDTLKNEINSLNSTKVNDTKLTDMEQQLLILQKSFNETQQKLQDNIKKEEQQIAVKSYNKEISYLLNDIINNMKSVNTKISSTPFNLSEDNLKLINSLKEIKIL